MIRQRFWDEFCIDFMSKVIVAGLKKFFAITGT